MADITDIFIMERNNNTCGSLFYRLPVVSMICTAFITYPNMVWIPWNLERLADGEEPGFWLFFVFRIMYFFCLFYFQLRHNVRTASNESFLSRFCRNFLFTLAGCSIFVGLSYGLPLMGIQTGYVGNILLFQFFVECLLCAFIGHILMLYRNRREKEKEIEQLRIENLQSQCSALANQINPHFFFNSLNGISSLIRKGDTDDTLSYITELSDIFRYILRSDRSSLVTLGEELEFASAFLHVMEVRFKGKLTCKLDVPQEKRQLALPVLSLLPLLENIAVHNIIDSSHHMNIMIGLNGTDELVVSNPVYPKLTPPDSNGTGLSNLSNRLKLMTGKDLRVIAGDTVFSVSIPLTVMDNGRNHKE